MYIIQGGVTAPKGYSAAGIYCGIKKKKKDLALIVSNKPAVSAAAYTRNVVCAAPVIWDKAITNGEKPVKGILINSGNANACTGAQGLEDCSQMAVLTADALKEQEAQANIDAHQIYVCSTGVIGVPLPMTVLAKGIPAIVSELAATEDAADAAAEAILTTDTFKKEIAVEIELEGKPVRIAGIAKGSGMIHPDMATMLSFIVTDANISQAMLRNLLGSSIQDSYNMISVDGDTSTNDTVIVLANGASDTSLIKENSAEYDIFKEAFDFVHAYLAKQIVKDGEGAGKFIAVTVQGAATTADARILAKSVITSNLVKTAFFGEDANWGRVLCAMGYSGVHFDPLKVDLTFSSEAGSIELLSQGTPLAFDEAAALSILQEKDITVTAYLQEGTASATAWGCDLSYEYVKINGEYRS